MAPAAVKRRNIEDEVRRPKKKIRKFKKQKDYHSSSEDSDEEEFPDPQRPVRGSASNKSLHNGQVALQDTTTAAQQQAEASDSSEDDPEVVDSLQADEDSQDDEELDEVQINTALNMVTHDGSEDDDIEGLSDNDGVNLNDLDELDDDEDDLADEFDSDNPLTTTAGAKKKRNDPAAFATSISKILTTKLSTQKRSDPILSRSKDAEDANKALADNKLDIQARAAIRAERQQLLEKGRVRDTLGLNTTGVDTGAIMEEEKRLKKTAQRGVVKLFNAVRAAQVKAEEAEKGARKQGLVGISKREDRINEMSKEGFLELISRGGKTAAES